MSLKASEFKTIKTECEIEDENEIKEEFVSEEIFNINSGSWLTNAGTKCGEIFVSNNGTFTLICANCKDSFENMPSFGEHVIAEHLNVNCPGSSSVSVSNDFGTSNEAELSNDPLENLRTKRLNIDRFDCNFESVSENFESNTPSKPSDNVRSSELATESKWFCDICNLHYKLKSSLTRHNKRHKPRNFDSRNKQIVKNAPPSSTVNTLHSMRHKDENSTFLENGDDRIPITTALPDSDDSTQRNKLRKTSTPMKTKISQITNGLSDSIANASCGTKLEVQGDARYFCDICNRQYKSKRELQCHAARHDTIPIALQQDPNYLKCKYCNSQFVDYTEWTQHKKTHKGEQLRYPCPHCQKTFKHRIDCEMHINSHTGEKPFKCSQCPKAFAHTSNLAWHVKRIHLQLQKYACDLCDRRFTCSVEKRIHMRQHTGEKPYQCELCGKSFMLAAYLNEHRKRHTKVKDVKCTTCGKCFYSKKRLRDHMMTHTGERPYVCTVCGSTFNARNAFSTHKKLHMEVKGYVCPICGMAFAQAAGLYSHKKSHGIIVAGNLSDRN